MHILRPLASLSFLAILLVPWSAIAQVATPSPTAIQQDALFEITLPRDVLPAAPGALSWEESRVPPGVDTVLAADDEFQARALYIVNGELEITPDVQSMAWHGDAAIGGSPDQVDAGSVVILAAGDLLYIPYSPTETNNPAAGTRVVNRGEVPVQVVGFHASDDALIPSHPDTGDIDTFSRPFTLADKQGLSDGDIRVALDRLTIPPGQAVEPTSEAIASFYQLAGGRVDYAWTMPDGSATFSTSWAPNMGGWFPWADGIHTTFATKGNEPAEFLVLTLYPSGS